MAVPCNDFVEPHPEVETDSSSSFSDAIIDVYETLREKLEPQNLLGSLYQERIITDTEMDRIKAASVVYRQNDELLSAVRRRSDKDILRFCQILLRKQKHCGMALKGALHKRGVDVKGLKVQSPTPPELNHKRPAYSPLQRDLKNHYIKLLVKVRRACVGASLEELKLVCGQLLRDKVQELPQGELTRKIDSSLESLLTSERSDDVLECLLPHSDYLDCELVHQLVTHMENDDLTRAWETYRGKFVEACKLTLNCWSKSEVDGLRNSSTLTLGLQTNLTADSLPIKRVLALQGFFCHVMGMKETEFIGCASSTVTLFFTVSASRLPFLLYSLSCHRKTLEDFAVELAFVPGEFIYSIVLDQEYELFQEPTDQARHLELASLSEQLKFQDSTLQGVYEKLLEIQKEFKLRAIEGQQPSVPQGVSAPRVSIQNVLAPEQITGLESKVDGIAALLEDIQSSQNKQMARSVSQGLLASEKRKMEEQMATMKKAHFEAVVEKEHILSKLGGELLKSSFDKAAEHFQETVEKHHIQFQTELKQLQEAKSMWHAELMDLLEKEAQKESSQVAVPAKMAGTIIGPKGQNFRRIEAKTGVMKLKLVPGPNEDVSLVTIFGTEKSRKAARKELRICCATREQVKEKKICFLTLAPEGSTVSFAEYKGVLPPLFKPERRFRKFYCLKLNSDAEEILLNWAKLRFQEITGEDGSKIFQFTKGADVLPHTRATLVPWSSVRNADRLTARFLCAVEEALTSGAAHLELEARFGSIFFRAERPLQSLELKEVYPISSMEKDAFVDTSMVLGITAWTFATIIPKTTKVVAVSDLEMNFIGEPELVNITLTYIPEEADCVQYVIHACRGKDGKFHVLNVWPKVAKTLMYDCLPLHGNLDVRFAFSSAAVRAQEEQTMMNSLAKKMADGLTVENGVVRLTKESKEGEVDFQISFIRYEKKKMYLVKSEGSSFILAHFSVEECDTVHQDIPDDAVEFPLKDKHYELELKNCQWLADFYHLVGNNWKEQLSSQGCDVSRIDVVPKPVDPATVVQELEQFAKYALQITPGQEE